MTDKLAEICATKREEVAARKTLATLDDLDREAASASRPRGFRAALESKAASGSAAAARRNSRDASARPATSASAPPGTRKKTKATSDATDSCVQNHEASVRCRSSVSSLS